MADRAFQKTLASLVQNLTYIQGSFNVGASGAVSAVTGNGVYSVTRSSQGKFVITLKDVYNRFLSMDINVVGASAGSVNTAMASPQLDVDPNNTSTGVSVYTSGSPSYGGQIVVDFIGLTSGALPFILDDPSSGSIVYFGIMLRNSSIKGQGNV